MLTFNDLMLILLYAGGLGTGILIGWLTWGRTLRGYQSAVKANLDAQKGIPA